MSSRPLTTETPEQMFDRATKYLDAGRVEPQQLLDTAAAWVEKWSRLVEEQEAGAQLDGRANIYTGETYAHARDRWATYRGLLLDHLRNVDGGGQ